jgi:hypothetical protein
MSYHVLTSTIQNAALSGVGKIDLFLSDGTATGTCPPRATTWNSPFRQQMRECCIRKGYPDGLPAVFDYKGDPSAEGKVTGCSPFRRALQNGRRPTLQGVGEAGGCVPISWTNQMGGIVSSSLCPDGPLCGSAGSIQQALTDLGYPCSVTGQWMGTSDNQALQNWRTANGIKVNYGNGPQAQDCALITQQWTALKGGQPTPDQPPGTKKILARAPVGLRTVIKKPVTMPKPSSDSGGGPDGAIDQPTAAETGWWSGLDKTTKYAIIGGGLLAVGGGAYLLLAK